MENIKLIKELNNMIREKDQFETALEEAGIEFDLGDGDSAELDQEGENEFDRPDDELQRIADHWREKRDEMSEDELRIAIGDDLEQLEYSPEEISDTIEKVMDMIYGEGENDYDVEPDVDDQQELEDFEQSDEYFGGDIDRM